MLDFIPGTLCNPIGCITEIKVKVSIKSNNELEEGSEERMKVCKQYQGGRQQGSNDDFIQKSRVFEVAISVLSVMAAKLCSPSLMAKEKKVYTYIKQGKSQVVLVGSHAREKDGGELFYWHLWLSNKYFLNRRRNGNLAGEIWI